MKLRTPFAARLTGLLLIAALLAPFASAQQRASTPRLELTIDSIMRGPALVGYAPTNVRWSRDNARVYFRWKLASAPRLEEPATYVVERDGTNLRRLTDEEARLAPPESGDLARDKTRTVYADEGDIYLYDHRTNARRRLTRTTEPETNPRFTADSRSVYFTRANNLYLFALEADADAALTQLTDIRAGGASGAGARPNADSQTRGTDSQETLKKQERELLDAVRERAEKRESEEAKRKARDPRKPFQLGSNQSVANLVLAPDGSYIVIAINESDPRARNTIVPNYVTESSYAESIPSRTNVGDVQPRSRLALIDAKTGDVKYVEHGQRAAGDTDKRIEVAPQVQTRTEGNTNSTATPTTQNSTQAAPPNPPPAQGAATQSAQATNQQTQQNQTQRQQQGTQTETAREAQTGGGDRAVQLFQVQWSEDGKRAAMLARSADNKDRWVMLLDAATARTRVLAHEHDDAWTNGPGAFTLGWLPDNRSVYFQSEASGFAHLYTVGTDEAARPAQLTSGRFEVSDVRLSEDKTRFLFTSSEGSPFERHLYTMGTNGGARTRLTTMPGNNAAEVSPDETIFALVRSYSNKPPELYLQPANAPATNAKQITTSPIPEWSAHAWIEPQIVTFKARDGADVPARLYKPAAGKGNGAAVIFVHGAGYLQNVHKWWSTYYREYMFHHLLMERGYTVLDIDYRGSAGYGRDWRTGISRFMGGKDLTDHIDGAQYLTRTHGIDAKRMGIYGGSYGGFITFMAMFTTPDVFAAGAALRPVTDWGHYNHPYTSNILNLPQTDREAYERSSPINHAAGLKGALLICHGMVDTNVHFQDSVRLAQRLIELRKENWELAVYPVEDHAFERPDSWADEYKRILKLFETNLQPRTMDAPTVRRAKRR